MPLPSPYLDLLASHGPITATDIDRIESIVRHRELTGETVYPPSSLRYQALSLVPPTAVNAIIVGQDPYHGAGEAMGLSFSVPKGKRIPPSLRNIFKELQADLGIPISSHGDLTSWAGQGVLLLNTCFTVSHGKPKSHADIRWQAVTNGIIAALSKSSSQPLVFILWGKEAQKVREHIASDRGHLIIESSHPSPIGGSCNKGFFGSRPFSKTNAFLTGSERRAIDWRLPG